MTAKDLRAVLDVVYALGDDHDGGEMPGDVLARLRRLVGCESVAYIRVEHTTGRLLGSSAEPSEMDITRLPGAHAAFHQHPGFAAYRSGRLAVGTSAALTD